MWKKGFEKVLLAIAAALAKAVIDKAPSWGRGFLSWWMGKTIAVIGPTASGKNSMYQRLMKQEAPATHVQTRGLEKVGNFKVSWSLPNGAHIDFTCKGSLNHGGEKDERERYWQQSCKGADVIFYLIDSEELTSEPTAVLDRVRDDLRWMAANMSTFKADARVQILFNKVDVWTHDVPIEKAMDVVRQILSEKVPVIEELAKSILGRNVSRISGISPISMLDRYLFEQGFTGALENVYSTTTAGAAGR